VFFFFSKSLCGAKNKESDSLIRKRPHALPVSGQSSVVHVSLCRCVSSVPSAKISALLIEPHTLVVALCLCGSLSPSLEGDALQ
jgi:hypothetical protein